jgi:peptide-methionine (S)-S-oxide reductase
MSQTIIFGGGCFWCMEAVFQMLKGVNSVASGYTGGMMQSPSYEAVCSGTTGHVEAIKIEYDPEIVKLNDLLAVFFTSHDPTTLNRQGNDTGTQYRSAIFYTTPEQQTEIQQFIQKLTNDQVFKDPIVTEVKPASEFYEAEGYHKNYYRNNENKPYCQVVISPKIAKLRKQYSHLLQMN